jgi:hypothetical protein
VVSNEQQRIEFLENHILHKLHQGENAYQLSEYVAALKQSGLRVVSVMPPYISVINHFPASNAAIKQQLCRALQAKFGKVTSHGLAEIPLTESWYRWYLSQNCNHPGRLYSFLCTK